MEKHQNKFRIAVRKFGPFESALQKMWKTYCRQTNCRLSLELVVMELPDLYKSTIANEGLKKGEWDVALINTDWIYEVYATAAVENLQPYLDKQPPEGYPDGWSGSLMGMQQFGDAMVGLPFHDGPECFIYRKDLFENREEQKAFSEKYGKDLQPPKRWEDFLLIAEFFQRPEEHLYGTVFAGYPDGHNTVFDFCLQLWTRGGQVVNEAGLVDIETDAAREGMEFYRTVLNDSKLIHPGSRKFDSVQSGMAFARGEVAMMVNWFGFASMCEVAEESCVKGKVEVTHMPNGSLAEPASLNVYYLYVIGSGCKKKELAYDFIKHAVNEQNDKLLTLEGAIGCRLSTWHDPEVNNVIPYYHKLESLHKYAKSLPLKRNWSEIAAIIDEVVLQVVNTQKPVQEILQEGQQRIKLIDQIR